MTSQPPTGTSEAIFAAALEVFAEEGVRGSTTREIARRAGVNEVTLFRKFGSKKQLLHDAISARADAALQSVRFTGDVEADLVKLASEYHRSLGDMGAMLTTLLSEIPRDPELQVGLRGIEDVYERVAGLLRRYQEQGALREEPLDAMVMAFAGPVLMTHIAPVFPHSQERTPFDAQRHVNRFLTGRANQS